MNTYNRTQIVEKQEQLKALDLATGQVLPDDILKFVISEYLPATEEVVLETMTTVKMQPRHPSRELKAKCRQFPGGVCLYNTGKCCTLVPVVAVHAVVRSVAVALVCVAYAPILCGAGLGEACCEFEGCLSFALRPFTVTAMDVNSHPGEQMWCTHNDYRLKRSCLLDCCDLSAECCCFTNSSCSISGDIRTVDRPVLHGPEEQWM